MSRGAPAAVHPLQPRFAQAVTAGLCLEAILFDAPAGVYVALALVAIAVAAPRLSPVTALFRRIAPPPRTLEPAAPVRFSQFLALAALAVASALLATGLQVAGYAVAGVVTALALLSAVGGVCVGCEIHRLALGRRRGRDDLREPLGLEGAGPWLVVLTAPGCARCEPAARELQRLAGRRPVVRVDLGDRPEAAEVPVRSVPAALAVGSDGRLLDARAGRLGPDDMRGVVASAGGAAG